MTGEEVPGPLLVVADTYELAVSWARHHGLGPESPRRWIFVDSVDRIRGRRGGHYVLLTIPGFVTGRPAWARRRDILDALRLNGFTPRP